MPEGLQKFSQTACTEVDKSFNMEVVNCPGLACI